MAQSHPFSYPVLITQLSKSSKEISWSDLQVLTESMNMHMKYKEYIKMMYEFQIYLQKLSIYIFNIIEYNKMMYRIMTML